MQLFPPRQRIQIALPSDRQVETAFLPLDVTGCQKRLARFDRNVFLETARNFAQCFDERRRQPYNLIHHGFCADGTYVSRMQLDLLIKGSVIA